MSVAFPDITPELKAAMPELRGRLLANQSLAELTWFRVGGPAQILFTPVDEDDLAYFLKHLPEDLPVYVVGVRRSEQHLRRAADAKPGQFGQRLVRQ